MVKPSVRGFLEKTKRDEEKGTHKCKALIQITKATALGKKYQQSHKAKHSEAEGIP